MEIAFEDDRNPQKESDPETKVQDDSKEENPNIDADFETGLTMDEVEQREDELTDALANFIMLLIDSSDYTIDDLGLVKDDLSGTLDDIESALALHGIGIYRPVLIEDEDGTQHILYSQYEDSI